MEYTMQRMTRDGTLLNEKVIDYNLEQNAPVSDKKKFVKNSPIVCKPIFEDGFETLNCWTKTDGWNLSFEIWKLGKESNIILPFGHSQKSVLMNLQSIAIDMVDQDNIHFKVKGELKNDKSLKIKLTEIMYVNKQKIEFLTTWSRVKLPALLSFDSDKYLSFD